MLNTLVALIVSHMLMIAHCNAAVQMRRLSGKYGVAVASTCENHPGNWISIYESSECILGASSLEADDLIPQVASAPHVPAGCYYKLNDRTTSNDDQLILNQDKTTVGVCSLQSQCICMEVTFESPSPTSKQKEAEDTETDTETDEKKTPLTPNIRSDSKKKGFVSIATPSPTKSISPTPSFEKSNDSYLLPLIIISMILISVVILFVVKRRSYSVLCSNASDTNTDDLNAIELGSATMINPPLPMAPEVPGVCTNTNIPIAVTSPLLTRSRRSIRHWDVFIGHTRRCAEAVVLATETATWLESKGYSVWLDVRMNQRSVAAMKEGVENSKYFIAVVTGPCVNNDRPNDDPASNAYFRRPYCIQELKWAQEAGKYIQPIIRTQDKDRIGEFLSLLDMPIQIDGVNEHISNLRELGNTDWQDLNRNDIDFWELGMNKVVTALFDSDLDH